MVRSFPSFASRLAALYAAMFVVLGIRLPFFPVWLKAKDLDAQLIGVVLAAGMFVRVVANPVATRVADRSEALRGTIVAASVAGLAGYLWVGLSEDVTVITVACIVAAIFYAPALPLTETYALRSLGARYGPVRLWGSVAFIAGSFAAGFLADVLPARDLIWLIVAALVVNALAALALAPLPPPPHEQAEPGKPLLRDLAFVLVLAAASLIQASHAVYYGFSALEWRAAGLNGSAIAGLWALGVVAEIVLFAVSGRLQPFIGPGALMLVGAGGAVLRWTVMALNPPVLLLPGLQLLHALSFGATYLGSINLVARRAPPNRSASVQGMLDVASGVTMAASMSLSGLLFATFGGRAYGAMALLALVGGVCALVAYQLGRRTLR
jgi:PPP family 3-phenylpropionic acid transporter